MNSKQKQDAARGLTQLATNFLHEQLAKTREEQLESHLVFEMTTNKDGTLTITMDTTKGESAHATQSNLPLFDQVEKQQVGTAVLQDSRRGHQHQARDLERAADLLLPSVHAKRAPGRPRGTGTPRVESEERTCAVKDTARPTDLCTCGHTRAAHMDHNLRPYTKCYQCECRTFTKADLTTYDERAASNWEKSQRGER
jgi:hypothetical protein